MDKLTLADKNIHKIVKYEPFSIQFIKYFIHTQYDADSVSGYKSTVVKSWKDSERAVSETRAL